MKRRVCTSARLYWRKKLIVSKISDRTMPTVVAMAISFGLLSQAMKTLPLGTAYAIWTGIGAVGTALVGIVLFGESANLARIACIGLIAAGIIGLKLATPA